VKKHPDKEIHYTRFNYMKLSLAGIILLTLLLTTRCETAGAYRYIDSSRIVDIENPIGSTVIREGDIPPGEYMTYKYKLAKDHKYHIYLNGEWVEDKEYKTDYDVYLYKYQVGRGYVTLSSHTESAGFIEQMGNDDENYYFKPDITDDYYISIYNDEKESNSSKEAILTVIEHINTDEWYDIKMEAWHTTRSNDRCNWAYEFNTTSTEFKVIFRVPELLDMYETRVYLMGEPDKGKNSLGEYVNSIPVAWSGGLKGEVKSGVGGFNFDPQGFRQYESVDSAQYYGEDMEIKMRSSYPGNKLYHLVLMAEDGKGYVDFIIQTDFNPPSIELLNTSKIVNVKDEYFLDVEARSRYGLDILSINYTLDNSSYVYDTNFENKSNDIYRYPLPLLKPGDTVYYAIKASDILGSESSKSNNIKIMSNSSIVLNVLKNRIKAGEEIIAFGKINNGANKFNINYQAEGKNWTEVIRPESDGSFTHRFRPNSAGQWSISACFEGSNSHHPVESDIKSCYVDSLDAFITCYTRKDKYPLGDEVDISGFYSFKTIAKEVIIEVYKEGEVEYLLALTDQNGYYSTTFQPTDLGEYTIITKVKGDGYLFKEASSQATTLKVVKPLLPEFIRKFTSKITQNIFLPLSFGIFACLSFAGFMYFRKR
jgi:hypothetical protein